MVVPVLCRAVIGLGQVCCSVIGWSELCGVFDQAAALDNQKHVNSHSLLSQEVHQQVVQRSHCQITRASDCHVASLIITTLSSLITSSKGQFAICLACVKKTSAPLLVHGVQCVLWQIEQLDIKW